MRLKVLVLTFFVFFLILIITSITFLIPSDITGAVVLQQSTQFIEQDLLVTQKAKITSVFSLTLGIIFLGTLTQGIFYRAKMRRYKKLDEDLEKEINYSGFCSYSHEM